MAENKQIPPPQYDLNAKWDACLDLTVRRSVYSSLAGAFGGLLLFRSPVTRWAAVAFGAGIGIGSAYTECSHKFDGSTPKCTRPSKVSQNPNPELSRLLISYLSKTMTLREGKKKRHYIKFILRPMTHIS
ncbi:Protein of unknown function DUF543 [Macleaya cordata]|uniref:MICOS complex subunit Mic10 n=1 Tax=Macleaya cordata TaxID=56857 RepID=A0A200QKG4_MACCD|nr:Protein of unknown function DUF543 [Macleaya cordata]